jgi:eukaryotic-like serine/threonine-protein kinase
MSLRRGSRVRLVDQIGAGASATVWRAWDRETRQYLAAKLTTRDPWDQRLLLRHPHVLTPHAWLDSDGVSIALLPLVRGGTVDRLLAEYGALPASYVAVLLDQLLDALGALHAAGLVHRDVKPANLLLEPTGTGRPHLWLGDLGVTTRSGDATTVAGTSGYVAPEVAPGTPATPSHDLYAAGVTAVELLTGRLPRSDRDLPRGPLHGLLRGLTAADPAERPSSTAAARAHLRDHAEHAVEPDGWPDVPDRMRRLTLLERWRVQGTRAAQ